MKKICVYCGSAAGRSAAYQKTAEAMADALLAADMGLVYGGARIGLMGLVADQMLAGGGYVCGVMPRGLFVREVPHRGLSELIEVASMHERKATMARLADGFIALPGGLGTLEELFEILTWAQLSLHDKPVGVLNVAGFFDSLFAFLDHAASEGFIRSEHRDMIMRGANPGDLLAQFAAYQAPKTQKWMDLKES